MVTRPGRHRQYRPAQRIHGQERPRGRRRPLRHQLHLSVRHGDAGDARASSRHGGHGPRLHAAVAAPWRAGHRARFALRRRSRVANRGSTRLELYQAYEESLYTRIAKVIEDLGLAAHASASSGCSERGALGRDPTRIAAARDGQLLAADGRGPLDQDAGEIELQKKAADLLDDVLLEVFPTIRDGDTEREVHAR